MRTGLRTVGELNAFLDDPTPRRTEFSLTAKVSSTYREAKNREMILTDDSGVRVEAFIINENMPLPSVGDVIRVDGIVRFCPKHEPFVRVDDFKVIRHGDAPEPIDVLLGEVDGRSIHLATVRVEGVVIDTFPDEVDRRFNILLLKDGDTVIPVSFLREYFGDRKDLIDARVRITGVYHQFVGGVRKFAWPNVTLHMPEDLELLAPPPADPFAVPALEPRLYLTSDEIAQMSKRSVTGEVLATWSGSQVMLREADGRIVNLTLENGTALPRCGDTIIAVGLPETDLFRLNLTSARWKTAPAPAPPAADENAVTLADVTFADDTGLVSISGEAYGMLLAVRGIVRTLPSSTDGRRFILDTGDREIEIDVSSVRDDINVTIGSELLVTGRSILLTDGKNRVYGAAKVRGLALVVRTPADIVVLSRPPWWTPARQLVLIAVLVLALVGIAIWNQIQKRLSNLKISERTRLAVEIHDTLSQNLAAVACQISAGSLSLDENPMTAKPLFNAAEKMLQSCRTELKNCLFDLRSDMLEEPHFETAVIKALSQLTEETAVAVRFIARRSDFSDTVAHAILSVIRELAANAVRHGHASSVRIAGCTDKGVLRFSVTDDGIGFDPLHCDGIPEGHFGLSGIRDRLKRISGSIDIQSAPGKGTKATVSLPIPRK